MPSDALPPNRSPVLVLVPRGVCSQDFRVRGADGAEPIEVHFRKLTEQGSIHVGSREFTIRKHGPASGEWTLEHEGVVLARGRKPSALSRRMLVEAVEEAGLAGALELRPTRILGRGYSVALDGTPVGTVRPLHPFTRRTELECDPAVGLLVRLFAFWLVALMWRRDAAAAASSG